MYFRTSVKDLVILAFHLSYLEDHCFAKGNPSKPNDSCGIKEKVIISEIPLVKTITFSADISKNNESLQQQIDICTS